MGVTHRAGSEVSALYPAETVNPGLHLEGRGHTRETSWPKTRSVRTSDVSFSIFLFPRPSHSFFDPLQETFSNHVPSAPPHSSSTRSHSSTSAVSMFSRSLFSSMVICVSNADHLIVSGYSCGLLSRTHKCHDECSQNQRNFRVFPTFCGRKVLS